VFAYKLYYTDQKRNSYFGWDFTGKKAHSEEDNSSPIHIEPVAKIGGQFKVNGKMLNISFKFQGYLFSKWLIVDDRFVKGTRPKRTF
jgi:hypothetical protein